MPTHLVKLHLLDSIGDVQLCLELANHVDEAVQHDGHAHRVAVNGLYAQRPKARSNLRRSVRAALDNEHTQLLELLIKPLADHV